MSSSDDNVSFESDSDMELMKEIRPECKAEKKCLSKLEKYILQDNNLRVASAVQRILRIKTFHEWAKRFRHPATFIKNHRGEWHLKKCVWSDSNATEGPDTCGCTLYMNKPHKYFMEEEKTLFRIKGNKEGGSWYKYNPKIIKVYDDPRAVHLYQFERV